MIDNSDLPASSNDLDYQSFGLLFSQKASGSYGPMELAKYNAGLTKREHFIAMAMQGLCANQSVMQCDISNEAIAIANNVIAEMDGVANGAK